MLDCVTPQPGIPLRLNNAVGMRRLLPLTANGLTPGPRIVQRISKIVPPSWARKSPGLRGEKLMPSDRTNGLFAQPTKTASSITKQSPTNERQDSTQRGVSKSSLKHICLKHDM